MVPQNPKVFIKPFDAPQSCAKKKIKLIFILMQLSEIHGAGAGAGGDGG